jgi:hypothetical protein
MPTHIAFGYADDRTPTIKGNPTSIEPVFTATGTAVLSAASAPGNGLALCRVATTTEAIYVAFGSVLTSTPETSGYLVPAQSVEYFAVNGASKASVKLAS